MSNQASTAHAADHVALGFYYQSLYALKMLIDLNEDEAAVSLETLDDIELNVSGGLLLAQLKHSFAEKPSATSVKAAPFWKTIKAWIDSFKEINLQKTRFCLVTVGTISSGSSLTAFTDPKSDRKQVANDMLTEANRVLEKRAEAKAKGEPLTYKERYKGCQAFVDLDHSTRDTFVSLISLKPAEPDISKIEQLIADKLKSLLPPKHRAEAVQKTVAWWDREVLYSLCGKRRRDISTYELQTFFSNAVGDLAREVLIADFETKERPHAYMPDSTLNQQIELVGGSDSDLSRAVREEWRAREQRSKWSNQKLDLATKIADYDKLLVEHWDDVHSLIREDSDECDQEANCKNGLSVLRWSHFEAPNIVRPFADGWQAAYLVRGSYQILAIDQDVGWHPNYKKLLADPS